MKNLDIVMNVSCNLNCIFCNLDFSLGNIDIQKVFGYLQYGFAQGCTQVTFTGGEPLLHKELIKGIAFAKKTGFRNIKIQSNLLLLNQSFLDLLIKYGLTDIGFTFFDATREGFIKITGGSKQEAEKYFKNVTLIGDYSNKISLSADIVLCEENMAHLSENIALLRTLGVQHINFKYPFFTGKQILPNRVLPWSQQLKDFLLRNGDFNYNLLYIPLCYMKGFEDKRYDFSGDIVCDFQSSFVLLEQTHKKFRKKKECEKCVKKELCLGIEDIFLEDCEVFPYS